MIFISFIGLLNGLYAQQVNSAFTFGEQAHYDVYYNWQFVWVKAAEVSFETKKKIIHDQVYYHFISKGATLPSYDWIYKVRDQYQAIADTIDILPRYSSINIQEGKNAYVNSNIFNANDGIIISKTSRPGEKDKVDTIKTENPVMDVLTAIYQCRNIDFSKLQINDTVSLSVLLGDAIYPLHIRYLGEENFTTKSQVKYNTIKFSVLLVEGSIFSGGEDMTVWVTNDKNRIPINVEAKILVGSIQAVLRDVYGKKR